MAKEISAGILPYRFESGVLEVFLVHPGGPFWSKKDIGAWSIPKGEFGEDEDPLAAAKREFEEETGKTIEGDFTPLQTIAQKSGKQVFAWAVEGDINAETVFSNTFKMEWPYKSGKYQTFPEVDKAAWFSVTEAKEKINPAQAAFINELEQMMK